MYKVKVLGAGSIGNHLANASRRCGWQVAICDLDPAALERTRNEIYPSRYGAWDEAIELYPVGDAPKSVYDLIVIGTPPDAHVDLAIEAIAEGPRAVLVEKPVCGPDLTRAQEMFDLAKERGVRLFVGYDHVVGASAVHALEKARSLGRIETLDVEFREYWGGIFAAHPWLDGPQDSYLGFWKRGGGASGEHSHAINLWEYFARGLGAGEVTEVKSAKKIGGRAWLVLDFDTLRLSSGEEVAIRSSIEYVGKKQTGKDAATIGGSAAGGAILGRVLGGLMRAGVVGLFIGPVFLAIAYMLFDAWVQEDEAPGLTKPETDGA